MALRAIASGSISFGLVNIPVKVFTATSSQKVRFNMLEPKTGARPKQQYISSVTGEVVERTDMVKGYEYARGQFVQLTPDELKALEAESGGSMDIVEFVPLDAVDLVQIEKSYYLGPDKGGDKAYQLLVQAMQRREQVAVARWAARGKEQLVLVRPYRKGLILHQLFYSNEVRDFDDVDLGAERSFSDIELDLADKLIDQLATDTFDVEKFSDSYTARVVELIDKKVAGQEIIVAPEQPKAQIIDLFEALKQSLHSGSEGGASQPGEGATATKTPSRTKNKAPSGDQTTEVKAEARSVKKASPRKRRAKKSSTA